MEAEFEKVKEKRAFEERMRAAEEAHAAETRAFGVVEDAPAKQGNGGTWGKFGFGGTHTVTSQDATGVPSSSHPAAPVPEVPIVPVAEPGSKTSGFWSMLGWK